MKEGRMDDPPSQRSLAWIVLGAALIAGALLTCVVLPADYGIDPLRTGRALGLTHLAERPVAERPLAVVPPAAKIQTRWGEEAAVAHAHRLEKGPFHVDSREITLAPGEGLEIKYHMQRGASMVFSWQSSAALLFDFHGQPDVAPTRMPDGEDYAESYEHDDAKGRSEFHGTLPAPSTGVHGWFWKNADNQPVRLTVSSAGYFDFIYQNRDELKKRFAPMDLTVIPTHPKMTDKPL